MQNIVQYLQNSLHVIYICIINLCTNYSMYYALDIPYYSLYMCKLHHAAQYALCTIFYICILDYVHYTQLLDFTYACKIPCTAYLTFTFAFKITCSTYCILCITQCIPHICILNLCSNMHSTFFVLCIVYYAL